MQTAHADYLIDIINEHGSVISQKPRNQVNKQKDLYNSVYVLLITPAKQLVLSGIPERTDLPNMYAHTLGATVATIRRHAETSRAAAQRALATEVYVRDSTDLTLLGESFANLPGNRLSYLSCYFIVAPQPESFSPADISQLTVVNAEQLDREVVQNADAIAPTLAFIWHTYKQQFPVW